MIFTTHYADMFYSVGQIGRCIFQHSGAGVLFAYFSFTIGRLDRRRIHGARRCRTVIARTDLVSVQRVYFGVCHQFLAGLIGGSARPPKRTARRFEAPDDVSAFHDKRHGLQPCDIRERIARHGDEVTMAPDGDGADIGLPAQGFRGIGGGGLNLASASFPFHHRDDDVR